MLTNKPISTISYNSKGYLEETLKELEKARIINEWYFIHHKGEMDFFTEEREKDHFHVYMALSRKVDTETLRDEFKEPDPEHPDKPLGVMPFMRSNIDDWAMYVIHNVDYLNAKGECKEFTYSWKEIQAYDEEALKRMMKHASATAYKELNKRAYVAQYGVVEAYDRGIIKSSEVLGMIAIQKQRLNELDVRRNKEMVSKMDFVDAIDTDVPFKQQNSERESV